MTCVVGLVEDGIVYMGADSIGSNGRAYSIRQEPKIFKRNTDHGEFLFGHTTSFRFGQLLQYGLKIPKHPSGVSDCKYMAIHFIDAVRKALTDGGYATKKDEVETGGTALIGYRGKMWEMEGDYQIASVNGNGGAVGCGYEAALGALYAMKDTDLSAEQKILISLHAAESCIVNVRGPFKIIKGAKKPSNDDYSSEVK